MRKKKKKDVRCMGYYSQFADGVCLARWIDERGFHVASLTLSECRERGFENWEQKEKEAEEESKWEGVHV